jgi:hydrogenase assembly chaperone HypC/HupF
MCFALTGKVLNIERGKALVDFDGIRRSVNSEFIRVKKGDSVLVFNGFVIERL